MWFFSSNQAKGAGSFSSLFGSLHVSPSDENADECQSREAASEAAQCPGAAPLPHGVCRGVLGAHRPREVPRRVAGRSGEGLAILFCSLTLIKWLVTGSLDCSVRVWDVETGRCVASWKVRSFFVPLLSVTDDGCKKFDSPVHRVAWNPNR